MASANKAALVEKYRATAPFEGALKIIAPAPKRQAECERDLATSLWGTEVAAKMDKLKSVRTPGQHKKDLQNLATTLERAIKLAGTAFPPEYRTRRGLWIGEELKRHLKETELAINWVSKRVKGSRPLSQERIAAVDAAYLLLKKYSNKRPTPYQMRKLAKVLLGNEQADLSIYLKPRLERLTAVLKAIGG